MGLTALRRSGVSFSEAQQEVIKNLFKTGREAEAQRMILKELEVEFGGAAAAAATTAADPAAYTAAAYQAAGAPPPRGAGRSSRASARAGIPRCR
jgi:hypothetical protein